MKKADSIGKLIQTFVPGYQHSKDYLQNFYLAVTNYWCLYKLLMLL